MRVYARTIAVVTLAALLILDNVESCYGEPAAQESAKGVEALRGDLKSPDPAVRGAAAAQLSQFGPAAAAATPELIALLEDPVYWSGTSDLGGTIGEEARFALSRIGEPAVAPLVELLTSDQPESRRVAALALGSIGSRQATPRLIGLLADAEPTVRAAAVEALTGIGDPAAFDPLLKLAESNPAGVGLESLTRALGASDRDRGIETFVAWTKHAQRGMREAAASALVQWREPRSIDALLAAMDDEYIHVQGSAALGMDWIVAERGFAPAEAAFAKKHAYHGVRDQALAAMLNAQHPRAVELALEGMTDESRDVRTRAIGYFSEHPDQRALTPLIAALADDDNGIQIDAAAALAALGDARAVPALVKALSADTPLARSHAAQALAKIGDPAAIQPLLDPSVTMATNQLEPRRRPHSCSSMTMTLIMWSSRLSRPTARPASARPRRGPWTASIPQRPMRPCSSRWRRKLTARCETPSTIR